MSPRRLQDSQNRAVLISNMIVSVMRCLGARTSLNLKMVATCVKPNFKPIDTLRRSDARQSNTYLNQNVNNLTTCYGWLPVVDHFSWATRHSVRLVVKLNSSLRHSPPLSRTLKIGKSTTIVGSFGKSQHTTHRPLQLSHLTLSRMCCCLINSTLRHSPTLSASLRHLAN